jgi:hypothetical protein
MNHRRLLCALGTTLLASPLAAQSTSTAGAVMQPGKYTIEARDTIKAFAPLAFELKKDGSWLITLADGNGTFGGKLKLKDETATYSDQGCVDDKGVQREGTYAVRRDRGGFWLEVQSDSCDGRGKSLAEWLFRPLKK